MFNIDDSEEVGLELKSNFDVPESCKEPFEVEFVWKATSFDRYTKNLQIDMIDISCYQSNPWTYTISSRMRAAVHKFAIDKTSMNAYLYHRLLGHLVEERPIGCKVPKR